MIPVVLGTEPPELEGVRTSALARLRALGRPPVSKDIKGYDLVKDDLRRRQHYKCCYCEHKERHHFNDVEHFRPKGKAERAPGCTETHGYWWLAFTWDNLYFACSSCNRLVTAKSDHFPLAPGSVALAPEETPPGAEIPLLLDPGGLTNPVEHIAYRPIEFRQAGSIPVTQWRAVPRKPGSKLAEESIATFNLNAQDLLQLRGDHVHDHVRVHADNLLRALDGLQVGEIKRYYRQASELFKASREFSVLSYDALHHFVPNSMLRAVGLRWPPLSQVGR